MARIRKHDEAHHRSLLAYMQMVRHQYRFGNFRPHDLVEFESRDWYVYDADLEATAPEGFTLILYRQGEFADGVLVTEVKPSPSRDELRARIRELTNALDNLVGFGALHATDCDKDLNHETNPCIYCEARRALGN